MMQGDKLSNAIKIFNELLRNGEINTSENPEVYSYFIDNETFEILLKIAETSNVIIKKINEIIYLLPNMDNDLFGFSDKEIREELYSATNKVDNYLFKYIILIIIGKFYSSTGDNPKLLSHISLNDLINHVTSSLSSAHNNENVTEIEDAYKINIESLYSKWEGLLIKDETSYSSLKTKRGVLLRTIRFLEAQNLIKYYKNEDIINTTRRCDDIMKNFYLSYDRKEEVNNFFKGEY